MDRRDFLKGMTIASISPLAAHASAMGVQPSETVNTVYVLSMCHLDIGFTDTERNVLLTYFDEYLPRAMDLATAFRNAQGEERYVWTIASWMIYQYLEQASPEDRKRMENAILSGDIAWHAMPFTWQSEMLDRSLISSALKISAVLDQRFGKKTIAGKLADVPGHTRGLIAPLAEAGVEFLDIGDNPGCRAPDVPFLPASGTIGSTAEGAEPLEPHCHLFNWRNPTGEQVMVLYHPLGYGGTVAVPGTDIAVSIRIAIDNSGPHTAQEVKAYYAALHSRFPGARIVATNLNTIAAALRKERDRLPVVTQEIGDTWIYGPASDPGKVARYRELCRLREEWLADGRLRAGDTVDMAFMSRLILMPEHNWGLSTGQYLKNPDIYTPAQVRKARIEKPEFQKMDDEWMAKRRNVDVAVLTLPPELQQEANSRLQALKPSLPDRQSLSALAPATDIETSNFVVSLDPAHGAIVKLRDQKTGREWASAENPLALFRYQTFTSADFARFNVQYNTQSFAYNDFGKPGMNQCPVESRVWQPVLQQCVAGEDAKGHRIVADLQMPEPDPALKDFISWPDHMTVELSFPHDEQAVYIDLQCSRKRPNRLAEAMWFSFSPDAPDANGWQFEKVNQPISPLDVIENGNRHLHAVTKDVSYRDGKGSFTLETLDAPLVAPGQRSLLDFNNKQPDMREGVHVNLYNNLWGTAFPQWYGSDMRFRFVIKVT
ncbi:MAG: DUF5054 domain-containing protein [Silvibacterium sp.]